MSVKKLPIVAIVGRANVGKSSLFNAILDRREAIVAKEAGTTRDSITAKATWKEQDFWMVDTAGMKDAEDDFEFTIQEQILQATDSADVIWVVVEANVPITEEDRRVAKMALKSRKPVFLVINKVDRAKNAELELFQRLGIKPIVRTSTTQHQGIETLLDTLIDYIPKAKAEEDDDRLHIAILGRPNVGKSYLFNTLAKKQQAIVADVAGTTRDINRTIVKYEGREVELMDTAGIRRPGKIGQGIEHFSVIRSLAAIEQADVCLLLMDVNELNTQLDQRIAGMIKESGKGLILVVSKWDAVEGRDAYTRDALAPKIAHTYDFVPWAPLIFTSSVTGQNVTKIFDLAGEIAQRRKKRIPTSELNRWLRQTVDKHPPAGLKNRAPKLNYITQEDDNPIPAFKVFGSATTFLHWSYKRFMERELRAKWHYEGTPVQFWFIEKHEGHKHGNSPTKPARKLGNRPDKPTTGKPKAKKKPTASQE
ncbi:MAG TPA: ribosome biogenesis GTPase Der [Candidatus Saccharimonadales bacterium]|nr:ribosome biogenesis GTPase Der [Candidatus Saccharimonadales bacterium]